MRVYGYSHKGKRENQEDRFLCDETRSLYAVVDGMGGCSNGAEAAETVIKHLESFQIDNLDDLKNAFYGAHKEIQLTRDNRGAVATAVYLEDNILLCGHSGDTRCYLARGSKITQITKDHNLPGFPHIVTNCFGHDSPIIIETEVLETQENDIIILTSDGIDVLDKDQILNYAQTENPAEILCLEAIKIGSRDNCTAIVIKL